jgi:lipopolysaccharide assembly outer membrane protein LptD (OstA)
MRRILGILVLLYVLLVPLSAQESAAGSADDLASRTLRFRIASATLYELRDLAAEYGLSAEGSADELRARLYGYFGFDPVLKTQGDVTMSIEQAANAEYFTLENGTKEIRLQGPLEIRFVDSQGTVHRIKAQYVVYNRDTKEVKATGDVEYTRESQTRTDTYKGQTIAVNLDDYSGVFIDGSFNMEPSGTESRTLIVHFGTLISHSEDILTLAEGTLTACDAIDPHYILRAKKIWLFGSGDWAVANATLYVGKIPVLWLPFFYYPSKAPVFHRVLGYRSRTGGFVQTTTYLSGKQSADSQSSSALSINQGALGSFGTYISKTEATEEDTGQPTIALLADAYSSLGIFAGLRGKAADSFPFNLSWLAGAGVSRSIFYESTGYYSPFDAAGDYASVWNRWYFGSVDLPTRIVANFEASSKQSTAGLKWKVSLPFYSDPFVEQDFLDRSESYDFFSIIGSSSTSSISQRSSFSDKASLSWTWRPSTSAGGFSFTLSNLSSTLDWKSKAASTTGLTGNALKLYNVDPQRYFFYPYNARPLDTSFSLAGTIYKGQSASLTWTNSNSAYIEDRFYNAAWESPEDIDFQSWYWLLGARSNVTLNSSYSIDSAGLMFQMSTGLLGQLQYRPYLYDERTSPTTVHPYRLADYEYNTAYWNLGTNVSWSPLKSSDIFSASSVKYSFAGKIAKLDYTGLDGSGTDANPIYDLYWMSWDTDMITDHSVLADLAARLGSTSNHLSFKVALPPLLESYTLQASTSAGIASFGAAYVLSRTSSTADLDSTSLTGTVALRPLKNLSFSTSASWDFDTETPLSLSAEVRAWSFYARFLAQETDGYTFESGSWVEDGTNYFRPSTLTMSWKPVLRFNPRTPSSGRVAWSFETDVSLSLTQNLIKYTNSTFNADFSFIVKNSAGVSLSFTLSSVNSSFWRYYTFLLPTAGDLDPSAYARNFFSDLWDSLSIWDTSALQSTLFKLQKLSLALSIDAHDWLLSASVDAGPTLVTPSSGRPYYEMDVSFTLSVTWKDISAIKSSISYSDGSFSD